MEFGTIKYNMMWTSLLGGFACFISTMTFAASFYQTVRLTSINGGLSYLPSPKTHWSDVSSNQPLTINDVFQKDEPKDKKNFDDVFQKNEPKDKKNFNDVFQVVEPKDKKNFNDIFQKVKPKNKKNFNDVFQKVEPKDSNQYPSSVIKQTPPGSSQVPDASP
ncbi:hypothetical protein Lsai_0444 [Legionella sainthelensi]|uniref:Uncharacterized protein n=1 Tax=Legionella sainthelensi TaxID=28087 RepID=A0A0W0YSC6_9GAMM|nr:hypothetical protein [Legionella sainthelensi]KTD59800.1 hypothetical protein Lsai_0444 [Legionella sainthelensi]VEH31436.1 Uncharacterised protein [Legionella sainthelensi]